MTTQPILFMKTVLIYVLLLCFYEPAGASSRHSYNTLFQEQAIIYTCRMHPEIQSSKPGICPKCGMVLIKQKPKAKIPGRTTPAYI
jgi:hypothetical protein